MYIQKTFSSEDKYEPSFSPQVLRLWLERKIFPESALRRYMEDLGGSNPTDEISTSFSLRRLPRAERGVDDPIRGMEGMLVDEYGRSDVLVSFILMLP